MPNVAFGVLAQAGPEAGGLIAGLVCGLVAAVLIGGTIGAVIIRAAVWLANKVVGGTIPDPSFGRAFGMAVAAVVVNWIVSAIAQLAMRGGDPQTVQIISALIGVPISFFVLAGVATAMLPTTFARACLVSLFYIIVAIAIVVVLVVIFAVVFGGLAAMR